MALIGVLGLLIIVVTVLAIMLVKLSFTKKVPVRRQKPSERTISNPKSQNSTQPTISVNSTTQENREPVLSALYAEAETPLTKERRTTDDPSQHYAEAGSADHYSETQAFSVKDEPKQQMGVKRGGKYGYSTVNKTPKKKTTDQVNKSTTLPRHLPNDNVYMPLTEGEYDHLNKPRAKHPTPMGIKLIPYQQVSLRKKNKRSEKPYDVPPSHNKMNPKETYDVPPSQSQKSAALETYDVPKSNSQIHDAQETYDVPTSKSQIHDAQETYDVPTSKSQIHDAQETYDVPGSNEPLNGYDAPKQNSDITSLTYDVPTSSSQSAFPGQTTYDRPPMIPSVLQGMYDVPKSQKDNNASPKSSPKL
ncbi:uncharacterized protein LOC125646949 [Ostrea edulis]|uniref:uncharacterized protein LOC125646949 n=1 Tax=Ostrea edulis TaxID=37623 RepID=UPI0024AEAF27|nr:uncharacterized protein LOC125646949 [Ostrea edulis]